MRPFVPAALLAVCCVLSLAAQAPPQTHAKRPMTSSSNAKSDK